MERRPTILVGFFMITTYLLFLFGFPGLQFRKLDITGNLKSHPQQIDVKNAISQKVIEKEGIQKVNPFELPGHVIVDLEVSENNRWQPFHSPASTLMAKLHNFRTRPVETRTRPGETPTESKIPKELEFLRNKTIIVLGDSIDRFFIVDFCKLVGGRPDFIQIKDPVSPPFPYRPLKAQNDEFGSVEKAKTSHLKEQEEIKKYWATSREDEMISRPWFCHLEEFGFLMVSTFMYGVGKHEDIQQFFTGSTIYPPFEFENRIDAITLPLLANLAALVGVPKIIPDLIQVHSGLWDLRLFSQEDFKEAGRGYPYPTDTDILAPDLSKERQRVWEREATIILHKVASSFPGSSPILWRTMSSPTDPKFLFGPAHRFKTLNNLARKVVKSLQQQKNNLGSRLILNDFEKHTIGTEEYYRDVLHPGAIPGSWINGDRILWELKRSAEAGDRNSKNERN